MLTLISTDAAMAFLLRRGIPVGRVGLVGASIGANLVSNTFAARPALRWAVLLSPGLDYRGVALSSDINGRRVLLASSGGDVYAFRSSLERFRGLGPEARFLEAGQGHGVQMFDDEVFLEKLLTWMKEAAQ